MVADRGWDETAYWPVRPLSRPVTPSTTPVTTWLTVVVTGVRSTPLPLPPLPPLPPWFLPPVPLPVPAPVPAFGVLLGSVPSTVPRPLLASALGGGSWIGVSGGLSPLGPV